MQFRQLVKQRSKPSPPPKIIVRSIGRGLTNPIIWIDDPAHSFHRYVNVYLSTKGPILSYSVQDYAEIVKLNNETDLSFTINPPYTLKFDCCITIKHWDMIGYGVE